MNKGVIGGFSGELQSFAVLDCIKKGHKPYVHVGDPNDEYGQMTTYQIIFKIGTHPNLFRCAGADGHCHVINANYVNKNGGRGVQYRQVLSKVL